MTFFYILFYDITMDMDVNFILKSPKARCNSRYIRVHYPEDYEKIIVMPGNTFAEQLYNYIHGVQPHICPICGKDTPFRKLTYGYSTYCSTACAGKSKDRLDKIRQTTLERYGVDNASKSESIKAKKRETITEHYGGFGFASEEIRSRANSTIQQTYGVDNVSKDESVKAKKRQTTFEHYGVESICQIEGHHEKMKQALQNKYGVPSYFLTNEFLEKRKLKEKVRIENSRKSMLARFGVDSYSKTDEFKIALRVKSENRNHISNSDFIGYTDDGQWIMRCSHPECNKCQLKTYITNPITIYDRDKLGAEQCTFLKPIGVFSRNTNIELFVRDILDEYGIEYQTNVRGIIGGKELDIYIPSLKMGIECNGIHWHSNLYKTNHYHIDKFLDCQAKNIRLITLWEDWIFNKPSIVKSLLLCKIKQCKNTIYARQCEVREIGSKTCQDFLDDNHIQGRCKASVHLGLYHNNKLVAVMCFSKRSSLSGSNKREENEWELIRFCNLLNYRIIGGASKLLNHFVHNYCSGPCKIISFSSNDISDGNLYNVIGFNRKGLSQSYWYVHRGTYKRYHRSSFTKRKLREKGFDTTNQTEKEIMSQKLPYYCIYDSGTTKWELMIQYPSKF